MAEAMKRQADAADRMLQHIQGDRDDRPQRHRARDGFACFIGACGFRCEGRCAVGSFCRRQARVAMGSFCRREACVVYGVKVLEHRVKVSFILLSNTDVVFTCFVASGGDSLCLVDPLWKTNALQEEQGATIQPEDVPQDLYRGQPWGKDPIDGKTWIYPVNDDSGDKRIAANASLKQTVDEQKEVIAGYNDKLAEYNRLFGQLFSKFQGNQALFCCLPSIRLSAAALRKCVVALCRCFATFRTCVAALRPCFAFSSADFSTS
ncbi:uncharacterized protein G2W53_003605 [Senna tora]|uniref:Uncharacterized protein n=1 Tax=Senna tora TaxID=362788 RepID=A0A835CJE6_9FABA|nr:uncharacterized protein G2W53_003605 [Senna tora]